MKGKGLISGYTDVYTLYGSAYIQALTTMDNNFDGTTFLFNKTFANWDICSTGHLPIGKWTFAKFITNLT